MSTQIIQNGKVITITNGADHVSIKEGVLMVDGKVFEPSEKLPEYQVVVDGDVDSLSVDVANTITVKGEVEITKTMSGSVFLEGDAYGDIKTMSGNIRVSGSVTGKCSSMSGNITVKGE